MTNDLVEDKARSAEARAAAGARRSARTRAAIAHAERRARSASSRHAASSHDASPRPFADATEAREVARSCREMLGRHIDAPELLDSVMVVLAAKVMDEVEGVADFEAVPGEPRVSASRFDRLISAAVEGLQGATVTVQWPDVEVPEVVAHQVLRDLGRYSVLRTAEQPDGARALRAFFAGVAGGDVSLDGGELVRDPSLAARWWLSGASELDERSLDTVATAAMAVFGVQPNPAGPPLTADDDVVVDLRDAAPASSRPGPPRT